MNIHILGICGTFMGGIAKLAKSLGHEVTGTDENIYPPMSTQLESEGISLFQGYSADHLSKKPDLVIVGNVIKRGNPELEAVLNTNIPYTSGPAWLHQAILEKRWVIAIAGTHGKTTTTGMVAWIMEACGKPASFLIGGVAQNFGCSARLVDSPYFVIEADEYDSVYFDKRSKFVHYRPKTAIFNNLEFDHADIFHSLDAIKTQFHHLVRTIPGNGLIVQNAQDKNLQSVIEMGCWTPRAFFNDAHAWHTKLLHADGSAFEVYDRDRSYGVVEWSLLGEHNVSNALAAIVATSHVGIDPAAAIKALSLFKNAKRRLEKRGELHGAMIYDDFAHHPTAIKTTIAGLRAHIGNQKLIAVIEFGSYTMRSGCHSFAEVAESLSAADVVLMKQAKGFDATELAKLCLQPVKVYEETSRLIEDLREALQPGVHVLVMSNTGFDGFFTKLLPTDTTSSVSVSV